MARNKVKLQYISNDTVRRSTLRKRRRSLLKKVQELSILCGVDTCGIIYSPEETAPQVWPQPQDARRIVITFNNLPEIERTRKMTNHLAFMQERVGTLRNKVAIPESDNAKLEVHVILSEGFLGSDFAEVPAYDLWAAGYALDDLISKVFGRICTVRLPPQAPVGGAVGTGMDRGVAVTAPAIPTALAITEAGPSSRAIRGSEGSEFPMEDLDDLGSSSDGTEDDRVDE